ncbi:hypothetical protein L1987_59695 [Smallanthus sonchifolius]|uniref:Uncharacterized protein n=1 Tax=Smallanthus sonchifolius TaxID=185202 RepID=A0ACB9D6Q1_9ASTR|nr:hypothetical protein L1987_59695 [Smallanthus sonchifolius]
MKGWNWNITTKTEMEQSTAISDQFAVNSDQSAAINNQISDEKNSDVAKDRSATRFATRTSVVANPDQQSSRNTITNPDRIPTAFQGGWILNSKFWSKCAGAAGGECVGADNAMVMIRYCNGHIIIAMVMNRANIKNPF